MYKILRPELVRVKSIVIKMRCECFVIITNQCNNRFPMRSNKNKLDCRCSSWWKAANDRYRLLSAFESTDTKKRAAQAAGAAAKKQQLVRHKIKEEYLAVLSHKGKTIFQSFSPVNDSLPLVRICPSRLMSVRDITSRSINGLEGRTDETDSIENMAKIIRYAMPWIERTLQTATEREEMNAKEIFVSYLVHSDCAEWSSLDEGIRWSLFGSDHPQPSLIATFFALFLPETRTRAALPETIKQAEKSSTIRPVLEHLHVA